MLSLYALCTTVNRKYGIGSKEGDYLKEEKQEANKFGKNEISFPKQVTWQL